jgi:hypothetical protein
MLAMIFSWPPQLAQPSISTLNTRFSRLAQLIATCRGGDGLTASAPDTGGLQYLSLAFRGLYCDRASLKRLPEFTARLHVFAKCIADDDEPGEFGIHGNSTIVSF